MSWRDILAFVDASDAGLARTRVALTIADRHSAWLDAAIVASVPEPVVGRPFRLVESELDDFREGVLIEARRAAETCGRLVKATTFGGAADVHVVFSGAVRAFAGCAARAADLVVLAQPGHTGTTTLEREILIGALFDGGHPCLMIPQTGVPRIFGKRIFIAWKGVAESARAVRGALPFLVDADVVRLCSVSEAGPHQGEDPEGVGRMVAYLRRHAVKVEAPLLFEANLPQEPETALLSEMEALNADMLVMGAYHRARWEEMVFGGLTRRIIHDSDIPVLFSH